MSPTVRSMMLALLCGPSTWWALPTVVVRADEMGGAASVSVAAPPTAQAANPDDPLSRPISFGPRTAGLASAPTSSGPATDRTILTLVGGLAVCVGAFLVFAWASRRSLPRGQTPLPPEVFESLGRAPLTGRQQLQLVRLGKKLILLCTTPQGTEALAEVTDAEEVERLAALCQQSRPNSVSTSFREVLGEFSREASRGESPVPSPLPNLPPAQRAARRRVT